MFWDIGLLILIVIVWTFIKYRFGWNGSNHSNHGQEYHHNHPYHHRHYHSPDNDYSVPDSWDD